MTRFPDFDPDGRRLPIKIDSTSNGEFMPQPLNAKHRLANKLAHEAADDGAKALGLSRRAFLVSAAGAATLAACNAANPDAGGAYAFPKDATRDQQLAQATVGGDEFIFDVQTLCVRRKIFGLNGARIYGLDATALRKSGNLQARREAYRAEPNPSFATFGPKTRRDFLALWDARQGVPG